MPKGFDITEIIKHLAAQRQQAKTEVAEPDDTESRLTKSLESVTESIEFETWRLQHLTRLIEMYHSSPEVQQFCKLMDESAGVSIDEWRERRAEHERILIEEDAPTGVS